MLALVLKDRCTHASTIDDFVRLALSSVMTNSLATEFNWGGRKKLKFSEQYFVKILSWLLSKGKYPRRTGDMKEIVANWLRLAPQRSGGKHFKKYCSIATNEGDLSDDKSSPKKATGTPKKSTPKKATGTPKETVSKDRTPRRSRVKRNILTPNKVAQLKQKINKKEEFDEDPHSDLDADFNCDGDSDNSLAPKKKLASSSPKKTKDNKSRGIKPDDALDLDSSFNIDHQDLRNTSQKSSLAAVQSVSEPSFPRKRIKKEKSEDNFDELDNHFNSNPVSTSSRAKAGSPSIFSEKSNSDLEFVGEEVFEFSRDEAEGDPDDLIS